MTIFASDVLRVTGSLLKDGIHQVQNVFSIKLTDIVTVETQDDMKDDLRQWVYDIISANQSQMAAGLVSDFVQIYNVTQDVLEYVGPWITGVVGGGGGDALPNGVSPFAFGRTNIKRRRGSKYFPATSESHQANGINSSFVMTALGTAVGTWISPFAGSATSLLYTPCIILSPPANPPDAAPFVNGLVRAQMGYQRRRKPGVGA